MLTFPVSTCIVLLTLSLTPLNGKVVPYVLSLLASSSELIIGTTHVIDWQLKDSNVKMFLSVTSTVTFRLNSSLGDVKSLVWIFFPS